MQRRGKPSAQMIAVGLLWSALLQGQIVINEVYYDSPGADQGCFTELKGPPNTSLDGYYLYGVNGLGGAVYATIDLSGHIIPADGYFVVAQDSTVPNADMIDPDTNWQNATGGEGDNVVLQQTMSTVDALGYGLFSPQGYFVGEGDPAPDVYAASLGRCPDGIDTNNNAADFEPFISPTPGESNGEGPGNPMQYHCGELQEDDSVGVPVHEGEYILVTAVAIVANGVFDSIGTNFYVQDDFGGVNVYFLYQTMSVAEGDCVTIVGTVSYYEGLTEIADPYLDYESHGPAECPEPVLLTTQTIDENGEDYEATLVRLEGCNIVGGEPWPSPGNNANILIDDGSGPCTLRVDKDTNIDEWIGPTGSFDLVGIINQYDYTSPYFDGYQILPRRVEDFTPYGGVTKGYYVVTRDFDFLPLYPNPSNSCVTISYSLLAPINRLDISIYNIAGRRVAVIPDAPTGQGNHRTTWYPENLASGVYVVRLKTDGGIATKAMVLLK